MRKLLVTVLLIAMTLAACSTQMPTPQESSPTDNPVPTQVPVDLTPAQLAAISALSSTLNLPAEKIKLISTEAVTWRDGCLGVVRMGMMCTQAEVPGFKIVLEAEGKSYEFHTNQDGSSIAQAVLSAGSSAVEDMVRAQLSANLGIDKSKIAVISDASIEFPDSCMGVAMENVMCAQVVTPGRIIVLSANNVQYEYHTNEDGSQIQPATIALTWTRSGGIAGFCDSMTVFLSGEVYGNQCKPQSEEKVGTLVNLLSVSEQKQFATWIAQFGQVNLDASDPQNVSDRMTRTLALFGNGSAQPSKSDQEALFNWAQNLFMKLYSAH